MKYAITADLQFDLYQKLSHPDPEFITTRLRDQIECFRWINTMAAEKGCGGLIVVGDVFDSRTEIDVGVIDLVCREFATAAELFDEVHIVVGNHDSRLRTPNMNSLQALCGLACVYDKVCVKDGLAFVPWNDDYESIKVDVELAVKKKVKYLFAHVMVEGAVPADKGMPLSYLKHGKFERIFLGDIHTPLDMADNVHYCGSPMHIDYRDAGRDAGFYVLDTMSGDFEFIPNTESPRFHIVEDVCDGIESEDFVRIKTDDPDIAREAEEALRKVTTHVESTFVDVDDTAPRLEVRSSDSHKDVLMRFCEHHGLDDCDAVVELGLSILEEANA